MPGGILPPLSVIVSWPAPNYTNPEQRGWGTVVFAILLAALSTSVVCARLTARIRLRIFGIDDGIIIAAMFPALAMTVLICLAQRRLGFDRHVWDMPLEMTADARKIVMAIECTYILATGLTKISILLFYRRLVAGSISSGFVWAIRASIFSVAAYIITFESTLIFGCTPINAYWHEVNIIWRASNEGKFRCLNEVGALYAANITSIVQDFLTFLMPLLLFRQLQLPIRQKILLGFIFGIGFFLCIVGIVRLLYTRYLYFDTYDITWESKDMWIWTSVELHGAVICASAPALKLFFERSLNIASTVGSSVMRSQGSKSYGGNSLRHAEDGSLVMVSQSSETQGGGRTYSSGHTIAELEAPIYTEKMEYEVWDEHCNGSHRAMLADPITMPCSGQLRSDNSKERNRRVFNASSCSWYDE